MFPRKRLEHIKAYLVLVFGLDHINNVVLKQTNVRQSSALDLEIIESHWQIFFKNGLRGNICNIVRYCKYALPD